MEVPQAMMLSLVSVVIHEACSHLVRSVWS
jgi:hypothetical protein